MSGIEVDVAPATFSLVDFDATRIAALVGEAAGWVGLTDGEIHVEVAEQIPLTQVALRSVDPIVLAVDGGAFEDPKRPRQLSAVAVQTVAVRVLARVADRRRPGFVDAPPESEVTTAQSDAWDTWALGRASRRGLVVNQPRWRYRFRTRHGFTDEADAMFDRLWAADDLAWADLTLCHVH